LKPSLIDQEIMHVVQKIQASEERITYLVGSPLTRENYICGNLYLQLRKYTALANLDKHVYYCSRCGERLETSRERVMHVLQNHEKGL